MQNHTLLWDIDVSSANRERIWSGLLRRWRFLLDGSGVGGDGIIKGRNAEPYLTLPPSCSTHVPHCESHTRVSPAEENTAAPQGPLHPLRYWFTLPKHTLVCCSRHATIWCKTVLKHWSMPWDSWVFLLSRGQSTNQCHAIEPSYYCLAGCTIYMCTDAQIIHLTSVSSVQQQHNVSECAIKRWRGEEEGGALEHYICAVECLSWIAGAWERVSTCAIHLSKLSKEMVGWLQSLCSI